MGTGCDTILAQMAAECLDCDLDDIAVSGADTDTSPIRRSGAHRLRPPPARIFDDADHGRTFLTIRGETQARQRPAVPTHLGQPHTETA